MFISSVFKFELRRSGQLLSTVKHAKIDIPLLVLVLVVRRKVFEVI